MPVDVLLATTNPAKAERFTSICEGLSLLLVDGASLADAPVVGETGASHMGIAVQKAIAWSLYFGGLALSSDGGLVIPALGDDWQSTLTRRATGEGITDEERARRLLSRMRELSRVRREAYWAEAVALARNGVLVCAWETDGLRGIIGEEYRPDPHGPARFWADGLWETADGQKRWEISDEERSTGADPWAQLREPIRQLLSKLA